MTEAGHEHFGSLTSNAEDGLAHRYLAQVEGAPARSARACCQAWRRSGAIHAHSIGLKQETVEWPDCDRIVMSDKLRIGPQNNPHSRALKIEFCGQFVLPFRTEAERYG